ncbi:hemolysin family protein [Halalkalibacter nanhaiisediminis]|uniref:CBS domain containing-hemolysin-like protein n=1 Tax=Halalkalibacter nanhaiisediminis TaxID=688079 RepID=A0A562QKB4_9BACI|nr:hemolysin family protein [Halalkalibacter nanhaiisediminis]TWI57145.1 CBS domain containing-hemolysin-like protein [Halalkalibacter nanhaiisediminis]
MDDIPLSMISLFILLLLLSAFFSSAETAYSSANKIRLKSYADEGRRGAKKALHIVEHFDKTLSTILVGNNLVNIAAATISAQLATDIFGPSTGVFISTFVVTILVLIFGEILPKSFAKEYAEPFALRISTVLLFLIMIATPVTWVFLQIKKGMLLLVRNKEQSPSFTEEELKVMVELSEEEGVLNKNEKELVHRSLDFDDILVGEILKPRIDIIAVDINQSIEEIKNIFFQERYSRVPIYDGSIDNIIGILSERDFLTSLIKDEEVDLQKLIRDPLLVVESMKVSALLPELQKHKMHMAIVIDEFGGTSGLITMEDILEEIVGEIWDEHDEKVKLVKQIDTETYLFYAEYSLDDFVRFTNVELPDTSYHTLGGWLVEEFQRIPAKGDEFTYEHITLKVEETENRRIRKVKVMLQPN